MPGQRVLAVGVRERHRAGRVGPDVGAALLLRHAHAGEQPGLRGRRPQPGSYDVASQPRLPLRRQRRVGAQRRHRGVRHRHRAAVAGLDLRPDQEARPRGAHAPPAPARPGRAVQPGADRDVRAAGARTDGSRPRRRGGRSGRGCAAPAGSRWPRAPPLGLRGPGAAAERGSSAGVAGAGPGRRAARPPRRARGRRRRRRSPTRGGAWLVTVVGGGCSCSYRKDVQPAEDRAHRAAASDAGRSLYRNVSKRRIGWLLTQETTVNSCIEYRVTGLAAEAASSRCCRCRRCCSAWSAALGYSATGSAPTPSTTSSSNILDARPHGPHRRASTRSSRRPSTTSSRAAAPTSSRSAS